MLFFLLLVQYVVSNCIQVFDVTCSVASKTVECVRPKIEIICYEQIAIFDPVDGLPMWNESWTYRLFSSWDQGLSNFNYISSSHILAKVLGIWNCNTSWWLCSVFPVFKVCELSICLNVLPWPVYDMSSCTSETVCLWSLLLFCTSYLCLALLFKLSSQQLNTN